MNFETISDSVRLSPSEFWGSRQRQWASDDLVTLGAIAVETGLTSMPVAVAGYYEFERPRWIRDLVRIGCVHSSVWYGVSPETKAVMCVGDDRAYVNVNLASFERSLRVVDTAAKFDVDEMTPTDELEFWRVVKQTLEAIDSASLAGGTFWSDAMTNLSMYLSAVPVFRPRAE